MEQVLEELNKTPGIVGSFVVDRDGIIVASDVSTGADAEQCSALVSALINSAEKTLARLGGGALTTAFFELGDWKVFLQATEVGHIVALAEPSANLGLLRLELRQAGQRLTAAAPAS
jgi:predicted regulator of Ras-like GTPase activity (Roadblock/LC7/MglB family)